ncbi:hypothetical protein C8R43DRAFT_1086852 [Mycena crocata]|nr:hypothetical protein C8R43DRAFT_1086852 [Mycena crocata]
MYDYYAALEKLTDNTGVKLPPWYWAFMRMCREYRHLLMLMRAGRGHDPEGAEATKPGELAVICPVCPHPGMNIPDDWMNASPENQYVSLHFFFLAMDACFRLKCRLVSSELKDPPLGSSWAYLLESRLYRRFLLGKTTETEMSTCSGLAQLDHANTKFSQGYSSTGVGMGVCARHEFVQPNGVGDLQKGEHYINMDYIFTSILGHKDPRLLKIIPYDIVCQWWKGLEGRVVELPSLFRLILAMTLIRFVIPKMHIHGHTTKCQDEFSLNLVPGSAGTDGEGIERLWANIGGVATSTREMGPGTREDTLNCHWGHWNWQKLVGLGSALALTEGIAERLRTRLDKAKIDYAAQMESLTAFTQQQAERVPTWLKMVQVFERNPHATNPYTSPIKGPTQAEVLLKFEEEEAARVQAGIPGIHRVSPGSFIAAGLEVEDQQRRARIEIALKKAKTTAQKISVSATRRKLTNSIRRLRKLQATYTPAATVALEERETPDNEDVESVPLFLPSVLNDTQRTTEPLKGLAVMEDMLREVQLETALVRLRNQLHIKSRLLIHKKSHSRHQGANTRSQTLVARNESKIRLHSEKYQMAWEAKRRLAGGDVAAVGWHILAKEDIRCMEDKDELARDAKKRKAQAQR